MRPENCCGDGFLLREGGKSVEGFVILLIREQVVSPGVRVIPIVKVVDDERGGCLYLNMR